MLLVRWKAESLQITTQTLGSLTDPINFELSSGEVGMQLEQISHDGELIWNSEQAHIGRLDDSGNPKLLSSFERLLVISNNVGRNESAHITGTGKRN
jgi:hypothetical protein